MNAAKAAIIGGLIIVVFAAVFAISRLLKK